MKRERLLNVIGQIDDRLVAGADPQAGWSTRLRKTERSVRCVF